MSRKKEVKVQTFTGATNAKYEGLYKAPRSEKTETYLFTH